MIRRVRGAVAAALLLTAAPAVADDARYFDEMRVRVQRAVVARDFTGLEALADGYRKTDPHTPSGVAYLSIYYRTLFWAIGALDPPKTAEGTVAQTFVATWLKQQPRGVVANIVNISRLVGRAGDLRGDGYADTVQPDHLPKIQALIGRAKVLLFNARPFAAVDPQWYAEAVDVALLDDQSPGWVEPIFREGARRFPMYMPLYRTMANYWLPQWYGDYALIDTMARDAAAAKVPEADGNYARIYRMVDESCGCAKPLRQKTEIDWNLMKRSMRAVVTRHPDSWNFSSFAKMSCEAGDVVEAQFYIGRMTGPVDPYFVRRSNGETSCPVDADVPRS